MWDGVGKMAVDAILTQRLSGDTGICGLDGDYLCDGKSGDGYHLPLSGSAYPVTGKFLRKQEMITCERKRQK